MNSLREMKGCGVIVRYERKLSFGNQAIEKKDEWKWWPFVVQNCHPSKF